MAHVFVNAVNKNGVKNLLDIISRSETGENRFTWGWSKAATESRADDTPSTFLENINRVKTGDIVIFAQAGQSRHRKVADDEIQHNGLTYVRVDQQPGSFRDDPVMHDELIEDRVKWFMKIRGTVLGKDGQADQSRSPFPSSEMAKAAADSSLRKNIPIQLKSGLSSLPQEVVDALEAARKDDEANSKISDVQVEDSLDAADVEDIENVEQANEFLTAEQKEVITKYRTEQTKLRSRVLEKSTMEGRQCECWICGRHFPDKMLVAAHIKPHHKASVDERGNPSIAMPACRAGCDTMFEYGWVIVDQDGIVRRNPAAIEKVGSLGSDTEALMESVVGRNLGDHFTDENSQFFTYHRQHHQWISVKMA